MNDLPPNFLKRGKSHQHRHNNIVPSEFLPLEIRVAFHGENKLWQSCATQPTVHPGFFSVSIIHGTLTWTTGYLMCEQMLMCAIAHRGAQTHIREFALKVDSGRKNSLPHQGIEGVSVACWLNALSAELCSHPIWFLDVAEIQSSKFHFYTDHKNGILQDRQVPVANGSRGAVYDVDQEEWGCWWPRVQIDFFFKLKINLYTYYKSGGSGGFFLVCKDLGRMFDNSFLTCTFCVCVCVCVCFKVAISLRTLIPLFLARISPQWFSELRGLWRNVPWQLACELVCW